MNKLNDFENFYLDFEEDGKIKKLLLEDTFGVNDRDYASFLDEENDELYIFRTYTKNEETYFETINNEEEFEEVLEVYSDLLDELD